MTSNLLETDTEELFRDALESATSDVYLIDPSVRVLRAAVQLGATDGSDLPTVNVVADSRLLKDVMDDFLIGADAADLIQDGELTLRVLEEEVDNTLLVSESAMYAIVTATDTVGALAAEADDFLADAYETYADLWERSSEFNLRTPPLSEIRETMDEQIGEEVREDFDTVLDSLDMARGKGDGIDEVTISLLVAAKNEALLYDISKWGEDVGIASKATFSRSKTRLEDMGIIDTEKVPIDVGRPRLRLKLGHDDLAGVTSENLAAKSMEIIY
jgi:hypothetical protein